MKIFVAGTFDHFHIGHQWLLWQACKMGESMTVIVAREQTVQNVKGHTPTHTEDERVQRIQKEGLPNTTIRLGREDQDFWKTLKEENPDHIVLGYDQKFDIESCRAEYPQISITRLEAYYPEYFKSSKFSI